MKKNKKKTSIKDIRARRKRRDERRRKMRDEEVRRLRSEHSGLTLQDLINVVAYQESRELTGTSSTKTPDITHANAAYSIEEQNNE